MHIPEPAGVVEVPGGGGGVGDGGGGGGGGGSVWSGEGEEVTNGIASGCCWCCLWDCVCFLWRTSVMAW